MTEFDWSGYYDRQGKPMTVLEWGELFDNREYALVGRDVIGEREVSTVWHGMDLNVDPDKPPMMFETVVFPDTVAWRYSSEAEACEGHARVCWMLVCALAEEREPFQPDDNPWVQFLDLISALSSGTLLDRESPSAATGGKEGTGNRGAGQPNG